jgi:hypothetical protein
MADNVEDPNPRRGFRIVTSDGKEKFLPVRMPLAQPADLFRTVPLEPEPQPLAQGAGEPPSEPPAAPPAAMEPEPEREPTPLETPEARLARLEKEYTDLLSALYWVESEISELRGTAGK